MVWFHWEAQEHSRLLPRTATFATIVDRRGWSARGVVESWHIWGGCRTGRIDCREWQRRQASWAARLHWKAQDYSRLLPRITWIAWCVEQRQRSRLSGFFAARVVEIGTRLARFGLGHGWSGERQHGAGSTVGDVASRSSWPTVSARPGIRRRAAGGGVPAAAGLRPKYVGTTVDAGRRVAACGRAADLGGGRTTPDGPSPRFGPALAGDSWPCGGSCERRIWRRTARPLAGGAGAISTDWLNISAARGAAWRFGAYAKGGLVGRRGRRRRSLSTSGWQRRLGQSAHARPDRGRWDCARNFQRSLSTNPDKQPRPCAPNCGRSWISCFEMGILSNALTASRRKRPRIRPTRKRSTRRSHEAGQRL